MYTSEDRNYDLLCAFMVLINLHISEFSELKSYLKKYKVFRFEPSKEIRMKYKDGGMAIIDQWIVAHAR